MNRVLVPLLLSFCAVLSACSDGNPELTSPQQTRSVLDMLKGPSVDGVDKTLLSNAQAAEAEGNYARAVSFYQQVVDRSPDKVEYRLAMANALRRADACNDAMGHYDVLIKADARNADALEGKGLCLMAIGEGKESSQIFTQVLEIDPTRWRTLNAVGILFAGRGKVDEAIAYFERAASVDGTQLAVMNNLGLVYMLDKRYDQAVEVFLKTQKRLPTRSIDKPRIDMNLALAYALSGDMDSAQKVASPHVSDAGLYNNMGFFAKLAKDETLARDYLNMALSKSPVYYERAWENLNMVRKNAHGTSDVNHGVRVQSGGAGETRIQVKPEARRAVPEKAVEKTVAVITPAPAPTDVAIAANEAAPAAASAPAEVAEVAAAEGAGKQWPALTPRSDDSLRAPEATSLQFIEPEGENRLETKVEGWME